MCSSDLLIEKAQKNFDEEQAQATMEKMRENTFDYNDFLAQMDQLTKMGPMENLLKMIPGMANNPALQNVNLDPKQFAHIKAIILSMTPAERENPDLMNPSRRRRLAAGAGRPIVEVNRMIKQFNQMRKMMKQVTNGNMSGMQNLFGGQMPGGKMADGDEPDGPQDEEGQGQADQEASEAAQETLISRKIYACQEKLLYIPFEGWYIIIC